MLRLLSLEKCQAARTGAQPHPKPNNPHLGEPEFMLPPSGARSVVTFWSPREARGYGVRANATKWRIMTEWHGRHATRLNWRGGDVAARCSTPAVENHCTGNGKFRRCKARKGSSVMGKLVVHVLQGSEPHPKKCWTKQPEETKGGQGRASRHHQQLPTASPLLAPSTSAPRLSAVNSTMKCEGREATAGG